MFISQQQLFQYVCSKVSNKQYFQQVMYRQQQHFDIQPYKIDKLYSQMARRLYREICLKYEVTKELTINGSVWYENQRKIFIWFIVCYFHQIGAQQPTQTHIDWKSLSEIFFHKNSNFLRFQFHNIIKLKKRIIWTSDQDQLLLKATQEEGVGKWNEISKVIFFNSECEIFKSPKHCRERWLNHLDSKKNKGKWSDEQDYKILSYVNQNGKKWSKIVQILSNTRTEHMIKNRFNSLLTKYRKNKKQKQSQTIKRILKSLQRQLQIDTSQDKQPNKYDDIDLQDKESIMDLSSDQQEMQQKSDDQFIDSNPSQEQKRATKSKVKAKISIETQLNNDSPIFDNFSLWKSFNIFYQNCIQKNDDQKISKNSISSFSTDTQLAQQQEKLSYLAKHQPFFTVQNSPRFIPTHLCQRPVYKICPVYIIQRNI